MDDIIDLGEYLRRREEADKVPRTAFAVWGGEGERARFALPLWRVVYLAGGVRGGLVWTRTGDDHPARHLNPFVVLDLAEEPARTRFSPTLVQGLENTSAPTLRAGGSNGVAVHLGDHDGKRWYLVVDEMSDGKGAIDGRARDDILFLAGECAGLLFFRGFASEAVDPE